MNKLFDPKGPLALSINIIFDIFVLSILWFMTSTLVLTTGLAYGGFYRAVGDKDKPVRIFVETIRDNFKQGLLVDFIVLVILLFISWSMWISYQMMTGDNFIALVIFILGAMTLIIFIGYMTYLFPIMVKYEYDTKELFDICLRLSIKHILTTIFLSVLLILFVYFIYHYWIALFFLPAIYAIIHKALLERILVNYS